MEKITRIYDENARLLLPERSEDSHKGSFGRLLVITGSDIYRGAAHLSLEAALRGGVGLVTFMGESRLSEELRLKYPEAIYKEIPPISELRESEREAIVTLSRACQATLVGCGCTVSEGLYSLVTRLLASEGGTLVLDADAINSLAAHGKEGRECLLAARRRVILTPHPLEFSRLSGLTVEEIQNNRTSSAYRFASLYGVTLLLKGHETVITDGERLLVNTTGSSALAKGGSGDVLAGFLSSLTASGVPPLDAAVLAAYLHGVAADRLEDEYSALGVTPSDLPKQMARELAFLYKTR